MLAVDAKPQLRSGFVLSTNVKKATEVTLQAQGQEEADDWIRVLFLALPCNKYMVRKARDSREVVTYIQLGVWSSPQAGYTSVGNAASGSLLA